MSSTSEKGDYSHNRDLFTDGDGKPMYFFMRPCRERSEISGPIKFGGGHVSAKNNVKFIRLYPPNVRFVHNVGYSSKFIWDSIKANRLLDLEQYKLVENYVHDSDDEDKDITESNLKTPVMISRKAKGRTQFRLEDDMKIINYIIKMSNFGSYVSADMWKQMADANLFSTRRSWESLKGRFNKKILPQIGSYKLSKEIIARFTKKQTGHDNDDDIDDKDDDSIMSSTYRSRKRGKRMEYTYEEDLLILNYIIDKDLIEEVMGKAIWERMEEKKVTMHTWQSMKDRFLKRIVYNLSIYNIKSGSKKKIEYYCCKKSEEESSASGSSSKRRIKESVDSIWVSPSRTTKSQPTSRTTRTLQKNTWVVNTFATQDTRISQNEPSPSKPSTSAVPNSLHSTKSPFSKAKVKSPSSIKSRSLRVSSSSSENDDFELRQKKRKVKPLEDDENVSNGSALRTLPSKKPRILDVLPCSDDDENKRKSISRGLTFSAQISERRKFGLLKKVSVSKTVSSDNLGNDTSRVSPINIANASPVASSRNLANAIPSVSQGNGTVSSQNASPRNSTNANYSLSLINLAYASPSSSPRNSTNARAIADGSSRTDTSETKSACASSANVGNASPSASQERVTNVNRSLPLVNVAYESPCLSALSPVNAKPSSSPRNNVANASPSLASPPIVSIALSCGTDKQQSASEIIANIHNSLNDEVTSVEGESEEEEEAVAEVIQGGVNLLQNERVIVSDSESESMNTVQENFRPPLTLSNSGNPEADRTFTREGTDYPLISNEVKELVTGILNGCNDITPEKHLVLLKWLGLSVSMDPKELRRLIEFLHEQKSTDYLQSVINSFSTD